MGDSDWDARTKPLRANIDSMQRAKRSANKLRKQKQNDTNGVDSFSMKQFFGDVSDSNTDDEDDERDADDMSTDTIGLSVAEQRANHHAEEALRRCQRVGIVHSECTTHASPRADVEAEDIGFGV